VFKKDLKVFGFLLVNGLAALIAMKLEAKPEISLVIGAGLNYVVFRINQELDKSGYIKALKK
jgi:hypothetical protein